MFTHTSNIETQQNISLHNLINGIIRLDYVGLILTYSSNPDLDLGPDFEKPQLRSNIDSDITKYHNY